jgi:hypothetical protein
MAWQLVGAVLEASPSLPDRQFRLLVALAYAAPMQTRLAAPGLAALMHQGACSRSTATRTLRRLEDRALIKHVGRAGPGHKATYALLIEPVGAPNGAHPDGPRTVPTQAGTDGPGNGAHSEGDGAHPDAPDGAHQDGPPTDSDSYRPPAPAPARAEPDDEPVWLRGPRPSPPPRRPAPAARTAPAPPPWRRTRPRPDDSVATTGAEEARQLLAARPAAQGAPPERPHTEDDHRAEALRQARLAAARRDQAGQPGLAGVPGTGAALPSGPQRRPPGPAPAPAPYTDADPPEPPEEDQW